MIYAKIYMEGDDIVFESIKDPIDCTVYIAGPYINGRGETVSNPFTTIAQTSNVAISIEAKEAIEETFRYQNPKFIAAMFTGNVEFLYNMRAREGDRGILSFAPNEGRTRLRLNRFGEIRLCYQNGFDIRALDDMKVFDNDFLKDLDISEPFDDVAYAKSKK